MLLCYVTQLYAMPAMLLLSMMLTTNPCKVNKRILSYYLILSYNQQHPYDLVGSWWFLAVSFWSERLLAIVINLIKYFIESFTFNDLCCLVRTGYNLFPAMCTIHFGILMKLGTNHDVFFHPDISNSSWTHRIWYGLIPGTQTIMLAGLNIYSYSGRKYTEKNWVRLKVHYPLQ